MIRLLFLVLFILTAPALHAAPPPIAVPPEARLGNNFAGSHFRNQTILQSTLSGKSATPLSADEVLVNQFEMKTYRDGDTNQVQLITRAPECQLNLVTDTASSTNRLQVFTPTTNFFIEGRGFTCVQSNSLLIISNEVATLLPKPPSTNSSFRAQGPAGMRTDPGERLHIFSDRFELHYDSNTVIYLGHVRVVDSETQLRCEHLVALFNTNRYDTNTTIERITAERNVTVSMPTKGLATGERAVYTLTNGNELIELTGHATWDDGERKGKADRFTFDHGRNLLKADGNAALRFPNNTLDQTNLAESASPGKAVDTNHFSELFAEHVTLQLLPTNAVQSILAEDNVVITNRYERSRATAQRAFYTKSNEQFELTGNPICELQDKGEVRGRVLSLGRTNQLFTARGDARVKFRLPAAPPVKNSKATSLAASTNYFLQISSQDFDYNTNLATFTQNVHAELLVEKVVQGTLDCGLLTIQFGLSNHVDAISARDHVLAREAPSPLVVKRTVSCDSLTAKLWPGINLMQSAVADGHVRVENDDPFKTVKLSAGLVTAQFSSVSNAVERGVAEHDVLGAQIQEGKTNRISGQRAVYTKGTNEVLQLTGNPQIVYTLSTNAVVTTTNRLDFSAPSRLYFSGAETMTWDLKTLQSRPSGGQASGGQYRVVPLRPNEDPIAPQP